MGGARAEVSIFSRSSRHRPNASSDAITPPPLTESFTSSIALFSIAAAVSAVGEMSAGVCVLGLTDGVTGFESADDRSLDVGGRSSLLGPQKSSNGRRRG